MKINNNDAKEAIEKMLDFWASFGNTCDHCIHKDVCKDTPEDKKKCNKFRAEIDYKDYNSIHNLFRPIFEWMHHHYPSDNVVFYVEKDRAQMKIDYGVTTYSDRINNCCC